MKRLSEKRKKWIERTVANDRSFKLFLYNRFFLTLAMVLAQLLAYALLFLSFANDAKVGMFVQSLVLVLEIVFILRIINATTHPSTKLSWVIVILIFPIFGVPMYLFNGGGRPMQRIKCKVESAKKEVFDSWKTLDGDTRAAGECGGTAYCTQTFGGYPAYQSGQAKYYASGEEAFPDMLRAMREAKHSILLEYFIIEHGKMWGEILSILLEKAEQGVQVRVLYDGFGCLLTLPRGYHRYLESLHKNIQCMCFNPLVPVFTLRMNNRDHRKLCIVDGKTAFTGGINLADEYIAQKRRFGYWKDSVIKIEGAPVRACTASFFYLWRALRKEKSDLNAYMPPISEENVQGLCIQPYDDSPYDGLRLGESVYQNILDTAKSYVWICTPYLILDDFMRASLCRASMRGVDVRIVTPGIPDKKLSYRLTRVNYEVLMDAGVKIYEYTPGFMHAKMMVCDDNCAVVGTINLDYRSLYHHFENAVYLAGCSAVQEIKTDCEKVFSVSKRVEEDGKKRSWFGRLIDAVLRVFETAF